MSPSARAGIVLAGGFSTRFGEEDKTLADLAGRPLLAHAIEGVSPAVDGVVVSCREEQISEFLPIFARFDGPVAPAPDPVPDRGPAAGIANALETVQAPVVAVVAADMPFVDGDFLDELFDRLGTNEEDSDAVVPSVDGHRQPTHAVYRTDALHAAATDAVDDGDGSLRAVLERLDVTDVSDQSTLAMTDRTTFRDVNTVAELGDAENVLDDRSRR